MRAGAPLLSRQADRAGVVQPGKESRETSEHLQCLWESWRGTVHKDQYMALHKPIPIHFTRRSLRKTDPHASALLENPIHFTGLLAVIFPHMGTAGNPNLAMGRQSAEGKNMMKCKKMLFSKSSFHLSEPQSCCMPFCLQVWMAALIAAEPSYTSLRSRSLTKTVSIQATA